MKFHKMFTRHVGTTAAGARADMVETRSWPSGYRGPCEQRRRLGDDAVPLIEADQARDNVLHCSRVDINGYPVQRVAVAVKGPEGAKLTGAGYVFDELTRAWYQFGPPTELVPGRIATFDIPSILEQAGVRSPIEFMLVTVGKATPPDGEYVFAMAPDVSNPGT